MDGLSQVLSSVTTYVMELNQSETCCKGVVAVHSWYSDYVCQIGLDS